MKKSMIAVCSALLLTTACGKKTDADIPDFNNVSQNEAPEAPETIVKTGNDITLNAGDDMRYDANEIRVKAGQKVKITLKHTGKMGKDVMGHNFVLLTAGTDPGSFAKTAMQAKDTDYIPTSEAKNIIAHTKLLSGGESDTIEFDAPAKGSYDFLCSFPSHYAVMKGKFVVE